MGKPQGNSHQGNSQLGNRPIDAVLGENPGLLTATATDDLLAISGLAEKQVEQLVADAFRAEGYQVSALDASAKSPDACLLMSKGAQRTLLQCKYWIKRQINETPVREFYGLMATHDATAGMLVTSGSFTLEASRFARYGSIQLIDGPRLLALLRQHQAAQHANADLSPAKVAAR